MSLYRKMLGLGKLKGRTAAEIEAVCGKPKKVFVYNFSDVGTGTRRVWSSPMYSVVLNFDGSGICCGVAGEKKKSKSAIVSTIVLLVVCTALVIWYMVKGGAG